MKNKIRVYATCFWQSDDLLYNDLTLYGFGKAEWKNIEFVTDNSFDIAVVLTSPHENHRSFIPEKAVTFFTEPPASPHHKNTTKNVCPMYLPLPWCFHSQHKEEVLSTSHNIKKSKFLSAVTSELCWLEGHQKRFGFLFHLDAIFADWTYSAENRPDKYFPNSRTIARNLQINTMDLFLTDIILRAKILSFPIILPKKS